MCRFRLTSRNIRVLKTSSSPPSTSRRCSLRRSASIPTRTPKTSTLSSHLRVAAGPGAPSFTFLDYLSTLQASTRDSSFLGCPFLALGLPLLLTRGTRNLASNMERFMNTLLCIRSLHLFPAVFPICSTLLRFSFSFGVTAHKCAASSESVSLHIKAENSPFL